jgi:hypothetical protein
MDKEIKARWLEALRSGKYQQGSCYLRDGDKYCCLGVLCEVLGVPSTPIRDDGSCTIYDHEENVHLYDGSKSYLSISTAERAGLSTNGELGEAFEYKGGMFDSLVGLNDCGVSFAEIADIIEEKL